MKPVDLLAAKYHLEHVLGTGGMGEVWAAVHEITGRPVAIKRMHSPTPELRARMLREARAVGTLKHKNIVDIYDVGETETGDPFLVMERLYGETLEDRLERVGRLPPAAAVEIATSIAAALKVAHAKGIVHRDLKPANVFFHREAEGEDEILKVLDFGVSKHLQDARGTLAVGLLVGSPPYMSPEQAEAGSVDARSDLWSLGVVLFEMLAGRRPFPSESPYVVISEILHGPIPSIADAVPELSPALVRVVERCLTRDVEARMASAEELIRLLASCVDVPGDVRAAKVPVIQVPPGRSVPTLQIEPPTRPNEPATGAREAQQTSPQAALREAPATPASRHGAGLTPGPVRRSANTFGLVVGAAALVLVVVFGLMLRRAFPAAESATSVTASGPVPPADERPDPVVSSSSKPVVAPEAPASTTEGAPSQAVAQTPSQTPTQAPPQAVAQTPTQAPTQAVSPTPSPAPPRRHANGEKRLVLP